jgi:uncharacterized protein (TIGR03067 family)
MRRLLLPALAAALMLAAAPREAQDQADKAQLQGTWRLAAVEIDKKPIDMQSLKDDKGVMVGTLAIKGDAYSFRLGKDRLEIVYKLIPDAKPKAIDLTVTEGPQKGKTYRAIYRLEGDTYTVCRHVEPEKERPTEFATRPDSGLMLVVWKRDQPK